MLAVTAALASVAAAAPVVFLNAFSQQPMATPLKEGEMETEALKSFKATGVNPYRKQPAAIAQGKALYTQWCVVCHAERAAGNMGPALAGKNVQYRYPQTATDVGMFAVIYGGAGGAMQSFGKREITQDEILKIIAYTRSLDE